MKKQLLACLVCFSLLLGLAPCVCGAGSISQAGGWNETIYASLSGVTDSQITGVSYSGTVSGSLKGADLEYLVRDADGGVRIDIPGVPAGTYTLTVTTTSGTLTKSGITVEAQDRSGYAHFGTDTGVGAYNNDGTLKKNAIVLYVTNENKNTVTVTSRDGTTVTGIGNILNSVGQEDNSKGKANTNQDILRKLAADGTPLVVRIIGNVTAPEGLTAYNSVDYGGSVGDNGYMARMSGGKDITVEGIGTGAGLDGWGLHFICQSNDYLLGWGRSFEVRNLTFRNVPEDCVGMEGQQDGSTLHAPVERCWIHHCAFYGPKIANPAESDKDGGDGACDFKRGQYFTNSYCYYEGYHKTNLVGSSDSNMQYHMTYHHNYWKNCESRGPLARQANIHMYNNIFEDQSSYCMNPRANAYIFSEYNLFDGCKNPVQVKLGAVKSYQDSFVNCRGDNDATVVTDKTAQVSTNCKYANFDTDSALSYIPSGDYILQESISEMTAVIKAQTGPQGGSTATPPAVEDPTDPDPGIDIPFPAGSYVHNFTENGLSSEFFTISGNLSTSKGTVTYAGQSLTRCLKIESSTSISFQAPENGTLTLIFGGSTSAAGKTVKIDGTKKTIGNDGVLAVTVSAGSHTVTKGDSINLFYMVYASDSVSGSDHTHSYTASVTKAATCTAGGVKTYSCECGDSYTESIPATGHDYKTQSTTATCTEPGAKVRVCSRCGDSSTETVPALGHSYETVTTPSTCDQPGEATHTCTRCGDSYSEALELADHSYESQVTPPTCTEPGAAIYTCTVCGVTHNEILDPLGHSYDSVETPPTCISEGYTTHTCSQCGHSYTDRPTAKTDTHAYGEWGKRTDGIWERSCNICGASQTREDAPEPSEPVSPDEPGTPEEPQAPADAKNNGQLVLMYVMIGVAVLSVAALVVVLVKKK